MTSPINQLVQGDVPVNEQLNCTQVTDKFCNQTHSARDCPEGYQCYDIGAEDPSVGLCFRDPHNCRPENSECCESTDCCRQVSDTNTAPLDCVQTLSLGRVCKVLI